MHISELYIYPIKSCRGIAVDGFTLDDRGPSFDRRWMLVDAEDCFMTQRDHHRMALIDVALNDDAVTVSAPGHGALQFGMQESGVTRECVVWHDTVALQHVSVQADAWFSDVLNVQCSLMRMPRETERIVDRSYVPDPRLVSLADAFPMLLIGSGSLDLLNEKLVARGEQAVPMKRFRPNVVVAGGAAHAEDEWSAVSLGDVACKVVKPCARCVITTIDTDTAIATKEPLRTLSEYRKVGSKVLFGQNVIHERAGSIRVGDAVNVR